MSRKPSYEELGQKVSSLENRLGQALIEIKDLKIKEIENAAILTNIPLVMMIVDQEKRVKNISKTVSHITGRSAEAHIGLRGGEALPCIHHLDVPNGCGFGPSCQACTVRQTVQDTLYTGKSHFQVEEQERLTVNEKRMGLRSMKERVNLLQGHRK